MYMLFGETAYILTLSTVHSRNRYVYSRNVAELSLFHIENYICELARYHTWPNPSNSTR